jgi:hypothetical protein
MLAGGRINAADLDRCESAAHELTTAGVRLILTPRSDS